MGFAQKAGFLLDRTAVLFVGLALGSAITLAFFNNGQVPISGLIGGTDEAASADGNSAVPIPGAPTGGTVQPATAETPIVPSGNLAAAIAANRTIHVGVFGDSFGDGIWAALYRQLPRDQNYEVHQFSHQATGFTRYRQTNLLDDTRAKIDRQPVDIAIISFGANDTQGIYADGQGAEYMGARWQQIVGERVAAVVNLLRERGAMVYWIGLPRMRRPEFDTQIQQMNRFYAEQMARLGVPYIETVSLTQGAGGTYEPYLTNPANGERFNARANDGIHMTMTGYTILTRALSDRIRHAVDQARGPQASQQANAAAPASNVSAPAGDRPTREREQPRNRNERGDRTGSQDDRRERTGSGREGRSTR